MARVIYVPIERLEERYSAQWDDWFQEAFKREKINYIRVGDSNEHKIKHGQFLDVIETNQYKANQLKEILDIISKDPYEPTTVFFMDIWFPGIQSIFYLREGMNLPIKVKGMIHAGTYDPWDFLSQKQMQNWGLPFEKSILTGADEIFCATWFHVELMKSSKLPTEKITIVDWPVEHEFQEKEKENIVVFPHRIAPEKNPKTFDKLQEMYNKAYGLNDVQWIKTAEVCKTKSEYYNLLAKAKVSVSTAWQETFGIAMVESVNNGCVPVAPYRLSYPDVLCGPLYLTLQQAVKMIHDGITNHDRPTKIKGKNLLWINQILN